MPKYNVRRKAQLGLDIREGGIAIPIAPNMYYMKGRSHDNGGIAIGPNNKNGLEVEGGEVVKVGKNDIKVFSSVPLLRGVSPAQLVMGGANPNKVFDAQEEFKDRNRINDDGTTYEIGGQKTININDMPSVFRGQKINGRYVQLGIPPATNKANKLDVNFKQRLSSLNDDMKDFIMDGIKYGQQILPKSLRKYYAKGVNILNSPGVHDISNAAQKITQIRAMVDEKKYGGNMIYEINGNVKNGLMGLRPKAQYGLASKYLKKRNNKPEVNNIEKEEVSKASNNPDINPDVARKLGLIALGTLGTVGVGGATAYGLNRFENYIKENTRPYLEISQEALDKYNENYIRKTQGKTNKGFTPRNPLNRSNNIQYKRLDINEHNIGLYDSKDPIVRATIKARGLNPNRVTANGSFVRQTSNLNEAEQRKLDKVYRKAVGNKEPKSGFGVKPADKIITAEYPNTSIDSKLTNVVGKTYDPTVEFRQANKPKPAVNTGLNNYLKKLGRGVKGLGVIGSLLDIYNNLFPSEEAELLEDLRVRMKEQSTPGTRMYKYGGRAKANYGKFLKYKNGIFTDPNTGEKYEVDPEVFKMYGNSFEKGVIPTDDYTKGTFDNARPQFYAEKRIGLYGDKSLAEKFGLARSGWSFGENPKFNYVPNINIGIPNNYKTGVSSDSKNITGSTPRKGRTQPKTNSLAVNSPTITSKLKSGDSTYDVSQLGSPKSKAAKAKLNTSSTGGGIQPKDGRWVGQYKATNAGDWIGLGSNVLGSLASYFITKNTINKMPEPVKPIMAQATKLKTRYNIEPQLTNVREAEQMNRAAVRRNTASSNTSLAREQRLINESRGTRNQLYGQKENIETQLINQDRLNRQSVRMDNVRTYNNYLNRLIATRQTQNQLGISNINNLIYGLTGSVNNILGNIESRKATNNTIRAIAAANPNVDARLIGGFDYYIDPITKKKYNKNQQYVGTING